VQNLFWHRSALICRSEHLPSERRRHRFLSNIEAYIRTSALRTGQEKDDIVVIYFTIYFNCQ
jgi:hypothetical protein